MKLSHYEQEMVIRGLLLLADAYRDEGVVRAQLNIHEKREAEEIARSFFQMNNTPEYEALSPKLKELSDCLARPAKIEILKSLGVTIQDIITKLEAIEE